MNEFEQKLSRQPLRQVPGEWRAEILREGRRAAAPNNKRDADTASLPNCSWLTMLLWPHPKAWAGLAGGWVLIFALDFSSREQTPIVAEKALPPSPEVMAELKQQNLLFAELMGSRETPDADRRKLFLPRPRSEREEVLTA